MKLNKKTEKLLMEKIEKIFEACSSLKDIDFNDIEKVEKEYGNIYSISREWVSCLETLETVYNIEFFWFEINWVALYSRDETPESAYLAWKKLQAHVLDW